MALNKFRVLCRHLPEESEQIRKTSSTIAEFSGRSLKLDAAKYDTHVQPTGPLSSEVTLLLLCMVTTSSLSETLTGLFLSPYFA
jgi:hypothetical protein